MANRHLILLVSIFLFSAGTGGLSAAQKDRVRRPSPLADSMRKVRRTPSSSAHEAFRKFSQKQGNGWKVRYSPRTALPEALTGGRTARYPGTPEQVASAFFEDNKELLKVETSSLRLALKKEFMGITHLQYQQYKDDLPVEFSYARVHVSENGEVSGYQGKFEPEINLNTTPGISAEAAVIAASVDLGSRLNVYRTQLVIFPDEAEGALKLAWKILGRGSGLWVYYINAADGAVLLKYDNLRYAACGGPTYGTSTAKVYAVSPLPGWDEDNYTVDEYYWTAPVSKPMQDQYFWAGGYSSMTYTNAAGEYCMEKQGKVFSSLKGPYFSVTNFRGASAHFDNGNGEWRIHSNPVQTPNPYANSESYTYNIAITSPLAAGEAIAKVMPRFSRFRAGTLNNSADINDADYVYVKNAGSTQGVYLGKRTAPFFGAAVENSSYTVILAADAAGTDEGFAIDISSYLVLKNSNVSVSPASVLWSTASANVYLDRGPGDPAALSAEVNVFYHLNAIHRYFDPINLSAPGVPAADLSGQLPVMVHVAGEPDALNSCTYSCSGMRNAYYDPEENNIMIGDGQMDNDQKYRSFALDGTIVRHEYIHHVEDRVYSLINSGESGAISEALADYFTLASFWREGYNGSVFDNQATMGNFLGGDPKVVRDISASGNPTAPVKMPDDWLGEVHDDGMILSQALYKLGNPGGSRYLGTFGAGGTFGGQPRADVLIFAALFYFPDNFANFREAMLDACTQFNTKWSGQCGASVIDQINAAFYTHGIGTDTARGEDSFEAGASSTCKNNNGPECATDISSFTALSATISPLGDIDYYSLPLPAGDFSVVIDLPTTTVAGIYHAYSMFLYGSDRGLLAEASPVIYGTEVCEDTGPCSTLAHSVTLNYTVPYGGGQYYLAVSASLNRFYGNSCDNSRTPYGLTLSRVPQGSASAQIAAALFDADEISFTVPYTAFPMAGSPSSSTLTGAELVFEYAQLRDHNNELLSLTRTNRPGSYLETVGTPYDYGVPDVLSRPLISGRVRLRPGFAEHYPGAGKVYLEVFGRNHMGHVLSLGVSDPINLTVNESFAVAYNNVIKAGSGRATIEYGALAAGQLSIKIYTQSGSLVKTLWDGRVEAGGHNYDWDGTNSNGGKAASGIYFVKIKGPGVDKIVKIAVVR